MGEDVWGVRGRGSGGGCVGCAYVMYVGGEQVCNKLQTELRHAPLALT